MLQTHYAPGEELAETTWAVYPPAQLRPGSYVNQKKVCSHKGNVVNLEISTN